ncbi:MAG: TetR/AcrR family transcriptional regulator [Deltaproteobacteria bacterium]|nr:TetR/AcrR family transcriptional regulator [Deltaproteobacteria bacterium]MBT4638634.1 TetR/AcrR family transcriptional regulator [Deltaproteobacteria bacterium]MBT6503503.1 TetR/AcrR family transcriptional regulator [Deltaproteobacteria bacterium]MBT6611621.1 TetR/AcrR family transcriptional regulator [Deltaproteobacteria bacterium]MBT7152258.1 TetR/AcrR family transcriptional regulator [Deltaproteobacteria bacterium]
MKTQKSKKAILDAAEMLFAKKGYEGTSMRAIAEKAKVAQGLIHYHCKTKDLLFASLIERHADAINSKRLLMLNRCFEEVQEGQPTLEAILESFIRPALEHGRVGRGRYYSQILATIANSDDKRSTDLVHRNYNSIAKEYIAALQKVLHELPASEIYWGYLFATSVAISSMARTGRIKRLSEGSLDEDDLERIIVRIVRFLANGLKKMNA